MGREPKKRAYPPQGPFSPPRPSEAEQVEGEPMAVANDKATQHGESFLPTTASHDQWSAETARVYRDPNLERTASHGRSGHATPHGDRAETRSDENRRMESPRGYTQPDDGGRVHLKDDADEDDERS